MVHIHFNPYVAHVVRWGGGGIIVKPTGRWRACRISDMMALLVPHTALTIELNHFLPVYIYNDLWGYKLT